MKNLAFLVVALLVLTGCISNDYEKYYTPYTPYNALLSQFPHMSEQDIKLCPAMSEEDVLKALEQGYVPFGQSSFDGVHCPLYCAIDCAKDKNADFVLIDETFKEKESYTSILFLPSTSTSYSYGTVYGSYGRHAHYSGSTTTTTTQAVPVQKTREIYTQNALFFQKLDLTNYYGAVLYIPPRLPTDTSDTPCIVRVLAVVKGSKADCEGIKRGGVVKSINGCLIQTRKDIIPFENNLMSINTMEVCYEK